MMARRLHFDVSDLFVTPLPRTVRVWLASPSALPVPLSALGSSLSPDETEAASRFVFPRDRDRYVAARGLLRYALGAALQRRPDEVRIAYERSGRPYLAGHEPLVFNVSHSGDRVAIAVALGDARLPLGVDIELSREISDLEDVARGVFVDQEMEALLARNENAERRAVFHRLWTRKEACMKASGAGFGLEPRSFQVDADAILQRVVLPPHETAPQGLAVMVHDVAGLAGYAGAVAVGEPGWTVDVTTLRR